MNETKDVEKRQNTANNVSNVSNEVKIVVDSRKLSRGLRTTFEGVAMIFDSLDTDPEAISGAAMKAEAEKAVEILKATEPTESTEATSTETAETENASENSTASAMSDASSASQDTVKSDTPDNTEKSEATETTEATEEHEEPAKAEVKSETTLETPTEQTKPEEPKTSITFDDITKVIVKKIQQNNSNSERIKELVNSFGVAAISQLAKEKYEAFMTELASL